MPSGNLNSITKAGVSRDLALQLNVNHCSMLLRILARLPAGLHFKLQRPVGRQACRECTYYADYGQAFAGMTVICGVETGVQNSPLNTPKRDVWILRGAPLAQDDKIRLG